MFWGDAKNLPKPSDGNLTKSLVASGRRDALHQGCRTECSSPEQHCPAATHSSGVAVKGKKGCRNRRTSYERPMLGLCNVFLLRHGTYLPSHVSTRSYTKTTLYCSVSACSRWPCVCFLGSRQSDTKVELVDGEYIIKIVSEDTYHGNTKACAR
jgi:hypothetical protein